MRWPRPGSRPTRSETPRGLTPLPGPTAALHPAAVIGEDRGPGRCPVPSRSAVMKITGIKAWQVDLALKEGRYSWSNGNYVEVFDSTVIAVETDAGITGYAEFCPL